MPQWINDRDRLVDHSLSALLVVQGVTLFIVVPLAQDWAAGRTLLDLCHLAFAAICIAVLTRHRLVQMVLAASIALLVAWPLFGLRLTGALHLDPVEQHEAIAGAALVFNGAVTGVVAHHVFAAGRVTAHRIRGAVLLYLDIAALFAILYGIVAMHVPHAFTGPDVLHAAPERSTAAFTYFSLTTITTTGYGDIVPAAALTRSLANLEAVIGQLFPATLLARLVGLHLVHEQGARRD